MGRSERILITGGSGLLGSNIARAAAGSFEVYATYHTHVSQIPGCHFMQMNITDKPQVLSVFDRVKPHLVIHTAGLVNVDYCEEHEDEAWVQNVEGTETVTLAAKEAGAKLFYISTDSVFDGKKGMYTEEDIPHPQTVYAKTKLAGEEKVRHFLSDSTIVRTAFYGWSLHGKRSLAEWVVAGLREGKKLRMWTDAFFTPILVNNLAKVLLEMHRKGFSGLYHVGGTERCSKYTFGLELARTFGLDGNLIEPSSLAEAGLRAPRPRDPSLDSTRVACAIDTRLLDVREGIALFKKLERPVGEGGELL